MQPTNGTIGKTSLLLNRRNLRIKAFQCLYAHEQNSAYRLLDLQKMLQRSIDNFHNLYHYQLYCLVQIAEYTTHDKQRRQKKIRPTDADRNVSEQLLDNPIVQQLQSDIALTKAVSKHKFEHHRNDELIKKLYQELLATPHFTQYTQKENPQIKDHTDIMRVLVHLVLQKNESYNEHLDDLFVNYADDLALVNSLTLQSVNNFVENEYRMQTVIDHDDLADKIRFGNDLMAQTLDHQQTFKDLITPQLKNWELDRIALCDSILLRMALCELMFFPHVPIKVTINEYVDISKLYSTPKSREFVNGVLDKLMKKLVQQGQIKKLGRGMVGF